MRSMLVCFYHFLRFQHACCICSKNSFIVLGLALAGFSKEEIYIRLQSK